MVFRRGRFSRPLSLLMPTFALHCAPPRLAAPLRRAGYAPLPMLKSIPRLRRPPYARSSSMPARSTGELLRTPWTDGCFQANVPAVHAGGPRYPNSGGPWGPWPVVRVLSLSGADVSTRALTPALCAAAFGVWLGSAGGEAPSPDQYLYLRGGSREAAPKGISGSTSYLSV